MPRAVWGVIWCLLLLGLLWSGWQPGIRVERAQSLTGSSPRVLLLLLPGLGWDDLDRLQETPGWKEILSDSALAKMNARTAGRGGRAESYLTLSAGSRARLDEGILGAFMSYEIIPALGPAGSLHYQLMGPGYRGEVLLPFWNEIRTEQEFIHHQVTPGLLADELARLGVAIAVYGNADMPGRLDRTVGIMAASSRGSVDLGRVDPGVLREESSFPGGLKLDWQTILREIESLEPRQALVVVEASDLARLILWKRHMDPLLWQELWDTALKDTGGFLRAVMDREETLLLVSPWADPARDGRREPLPPVILWGHGTGLLTSPTTRTPGLVANTDMAATVVGLITGSRKALGYGRSMEVIPGHLGPSLLSGRARLLEANDARRAPLIQTYIGLVLVTVAGAALYWLRGGCSSRLISMAAAAAMIYPAGLVLLGLSPGLNPVFSVALCLLGSLAGAVVLARSKSLGMLLPFLVWVLVLGEVWLGNPLSRLSPLGYSHLAGARYYGLGNEMGGILAGGGLYLAGLLGGGGGLLVLLVSLVSLSGPELGANFGLAAALVVGWAIAWWARKGVLVSVAALLAAMVLVGGATLAADAIRDPSVRSHLGEILSDPNPAVQIMETAQRKVAMNLRLFGWTVWTRGFLATGILLGWLLKARPQPLDHILSGRGGVDRCLMGVLGGSMAALVLNDSGVVAAATWLIYPAFGLLCMALAEIERARERDGHI